MNFLLDTHVFLWAIFEPEKLPKKLKTLVLSPEATIYISIITFWEISLKFSLGKLDLKGILPDELPKIARRDSFEILDLNIDMASSFYKLPRLSNKDPFDRMIAWQAISKDYSLMTKDSNFTGYNKYGLKTVW